ncbi:hypothetical protein CN907_26240 [Bacillus anthracis]|nr:hypothetical protein CN907_26240 [Bacillus anthracis]
MALGGGQSLGARTLNKQAELLLKIDKGRESVLMRVQEIPIRKHIVGMSVFCLPTLRVYKILYSFSAHSVTKENPKTAPG